MVDVIKGRAPHSIEANESQVELRVLAQAEGRFKIELRTLRAEGSKAVVFGGPEYREVDDLSQAIAEARILAIKRGARALYVSVESGDVSIPEGTWSQQ